MDDSAERPGLRGWEQLVAAATFIGDNRFPIPAYSEFMPSPFVGCKPYGFRDPNVLPDGDPYGLSISEYEQAHELHPGLARIAAHLALTFRKLHQGHAHLSRNLLTDNPYWPPELAERAPSLKQQSLLMILPLALSRTQDDKGRVRWTLFGASEQGPARPFWNSFRSGPDRELPEVEARALLQRIVALTGLSEWADLSALRILPAAAPGDTRFPEWENEHLPSSLKPLVIGEEASLSGVRALLTFRPFAYLPAHIKEAVFAGQLTLLPAPGSLVFFGHPGYHKLARRLPHAMQLALLHQFPRDRAAATGIRIPQSGWLDEHRQRESAPLHAHAQVRGHIKRTHRWNRVACDEDEDAVLPTEERVAHVLVSTDPEQLGLYDKPMARNAQLWTRDYRLLLNGPLASRERIDEAATCLRDGGQFGYRFLFPPMRVGRAEVYWHLPLCAAAPLAADADDGTQQVDVLPLRSGPTGYLTAYQDAVAPSSLWPRLLRRPGHTEAAELFEHDPGYRAHLTAYNVRKILQARDLLGGPLAASMARRLIDIPHRATVDSWLDGLPGHAADPARGEALRQLLQQTVTPNPDSADVVPTSLTFAATATRSFEERYYRTISLLCGANFAHKDTADPVENITAQAPANSVEPTAACDLPVIGELLHEKYRELIVHHRMQGRAVSANHWFRWSTECPMPWSGGWSQNQLGRARERNIVMIIPGNDRSQAVIMADHYDTAYMEDVYDRDRGGDHTRRAAAGADDNHSATAALLMAADVLLPLSRAGQLQHDVWLVHLTGEEFPADCLGARNLVQRLVEGNLALEIPGQGLLDVSEVRVRGAFILDMVAHNQEKERYVFQIAPGEGAGSMRTALTAHLANERWNRSTPTWNQRAERQTPGPSQRLGSGEVPPAVAHPVMAGEIRPSWHWKSSLFNTDAQILSDAGIPVVLLMENYDINRSGYHDTKDSLDNIDLDYGAALVAIAIESVAALASGDAPKAAGQAPSA